MKKLLLFFACLVFASSASAWGILQSLVSHNGNPYIYKNSFLYYVLTTQNPKVRVCVSTEGTSTDPVRQKITRDYFVRSTQEALDTWLAFIRTQLGEAQPVQTAPTKGKKKAKKQQPVAPASEFARKAEFADILAALPRRIELQVINPNGEDCDKAMKGKYDLRIKSLGNFQYGSIKQQYFKHRGTAGGIKGVYDKDKTIWKLSLPGNDDYSANEVASREAEKNNRIFAGGYVMDYSMKGVTLHELGHFFGLADLYADKQNMDKVHSLLRVEPHEMVFKGVSSIMGNDKDILTCDDLEGFINAVDFIWGMEGKNSPRVQNGWKSLCGKPYTYLQGIPAKDSADLAKVQAYLKSWKQNAGAAGQLVQIAQDWNAYLGKVEQARDARCESLQSKRGVGVSLDNQGLALSAECQYLTQKADKISEIIKQQIEPVQVANSKGNASSQQIAKLVQDLNQYKGQYAPGSEILDAKGILTAKPMDSDFSSVTYPCLVCGKPVGKENGYLCQDVKVNGRIRPYHIHMACEEQAQANWSKLGKTYQHNATKRAVPTWAQLTQPQGNHNPLLAQLGTEFTPARKTAPVALASPVATKGSTATPRKTTPAATPVKPAGATAKKTTPAAVSQKPVSDGQKTAPVKQVLTAANVPAKPVQTVATTAPKAKCVVCKQEMADGSFYTDSVGRTVHKHSLCAYRFFKRFHKTDEDSLTRYSDYYFFSMPNDVVQAKADMRKLDLTFADIRRYRAQEEASADEFKKSLEAEKAAKAQAQAKAEKCRLVVQVTPADVQTYEKENKAVLARIAQKEAGGRPLSKKEAAVKRYYKQLKDNLALTEACKG
ncbi:hypothetical protein [Candidatus Avelusimicrobium sp.]|uniref:hypothetical protein n=1 Tax=Candidatus Avelusimicrobium sp. TaxID=3048833 RepID=UPI003D7EA970